MNVASFLSSTVMVLFLLARSEASTVVFDNLPGGAGDLNWGWRSDAGESARGSSNLAAENFDILISTTLTSVSWTGLYEFETGGPAPPPPADDFTLRFYSSLNNRPDQLLEIYDVQDNVSRTESGFDLLGAQIYQFTAAIDFTTDTFTRYWFSVQNDTSADPIDWFWSGALGSEDSYDFREPEGWTTTGLRGIRSISLDFTLSVPEPSTGLLVICGLPPFFLRRGRGR